EARARVARGDVAQHARHDAPAVELGAVGTHRRLAARAARDVAIRLGGELLAGLPLQLLIGDRDGGALPLHPGEVDRELPLAAIGSWGCAAHVLRLLCRGSMPACRG